VEKSSNDLRWDLQYPDGAGCRNPEKNRFDLMQRDYAFAIGLYPGRKWQRDY
jgi:hypothetical protein